MSYGITGSEGVQHLGMHQTHLATDTREVRVEIQSKPNINKHCFVHLFCDAQLRGGFRILGAAVLSPGVYQTHQVGIVPCFRDLQVGLSMVPGAWASSLQCTRTMRNSVDALHDLGRIAQASLRANRFVNARMNINRFQPLTLAYSCRNLEQQRAFVSSSITSMFPMRGSFSCGHRLALTSRQR